MRFRAIALSCILVAGSAGSMKTMAASPDCARWIREYQQGLSKRAVLGKKHVTHAAHRLVRKPLRPRLMPVSSPTHKLHPAKLSPQEMLKRFKVLCGEDLPADSMPAEFVPTGLEEAFIPTTPLEEQPLIDDGGGQPTGGTPTGTDGGTNPTAPIVSSNPVNPLIPSIPGAPIITGGGGGGTSGGGGGTTGGGTTGGGTTGGGTTGGGTTGGGTTGGGTDGGTDGGTTGGGTTGGGTTPVSPVPEPGSLLLVATGALGALPLLRRRLRRRP